MKKESKYNVLSLCDGMSCAQIALVESGIKYDRYYASEIDRHCIKQTQLNFPDTIQLGDIEGWREWNIDWASISLILAGTPCTGFSFAGKMLNFDDPQSRLFWVFAEILKHIRGFNSGVLFLFENVRMKNECLRIISEALGVWPVFINSALVSAQIRKRYYWSNIRTRRTDLFNEIPTTDIPQPKDRGILLRDILEDNIDEKYYLSEKSLKRILKMSPRIMPYKSYCLTSGQKERKRKITLVIDTKGRIKKNHQKAGCLTGGGGHGAGNHSDMDLILQLGRGFNKGGIHKDKSPTVSANSFEQNNFLITPNYIQYDISGKGYRSQTDRAYYENGKHGTLGAIRTDSKTGVLIDGLIRRLTPTECARLQTVPSWYKWECSDTQIYRMLGNGWTIEVIKHIMGFLEAINETNN